MIFLRDARLELSSVIVTNRSPRPFHPVGLDGPIGFGMHAGYVTVDKAKGRALYYILTEKATEPETAPLVLWLKCAPVQHVCNAVRLTRINC